MERSQRIPRRNGAHKKRFLSNRRRSHTTQVEFAVEDHDIQHHTEDASHHAGGSSHDVTEDKIPMNDRRRGRTTLNEFVVEDYDLQHQDDDGSQHAGGSSLDDTQDPIGVIFKEDDRPAANGFIEDDETAALLTPSVSDYTSEANYDITQEPIRMIFRRDDEPTPQAFLIEDDPANPYPLHPEEYDEYDEYEAAGYDDINGILAPYTPPYYDNGTLTSSSYEMNNLERMYLAEPWGRDYSDQPSLPWTFPSRRQERVTIPEDIVYQYIYLYLSADNFATRWTNLSPAAA